MKRLNLLPFCCLLCCAFSCNRKQAAVQQVEKTPEVIEEVVEEKVEEEEEPDGSSKETQVANATRAIGQFGEIMQLTERQKADIYQMAYGFDFSANSDAEAEKKYKEFRKGIRDILTEEQKQKIKEARKKQKKDGK
ncbi:MAG: hypothetical protein AAF990_22225 [Bacteroidota bacterium]